MSDVRSITLTIPSGSLGVEIEPSDDGSGVLVVVKRAFVNSPLVVGDVITSVNGVQLATLPGGFNAWVNLIRDTASRHRSLGVTRAVAAAAPSKAHAASPFPVAPAPPRGKTGPGVGQSAPGKAAAIENVTASSDDESMSKTDANPGGPSRSVARTAAEPPKAPAASPISVASAPSTGVAELAPAPSARRGAPGGAAAVGGDMASSDDESMSESDSNPDGPTSSLDREAGVTRTVAAPPAAFPFVAPVDGAEPSPAPSARRGAPGGAAMVEGDMASSDDESMSEADSNLDGSTTSLDHAAIRARALAMLGLPSPVSAAGDDAGDGAATASDEDFDDGDDSSDSSASTASSAASAIDHDGVKARAESLLLQLSSGLDPPSATFAHGENHGVRGVETAKPEVSNQTSRQHTAPAPPMWRFQTIAKKSEGYSSAAAGSYIAGKSSSELAAKYVAPADEPAAPLHNKADEGGEIGRITTSVPKTDAFVKTDREVGRLNIAGQERGEDVMRGRQSNKKMALQGQENSQPGGLPTGSFNGILPKPENSSPDSRQSFREFNEQYEVAETKARDIEQHSTGNIQDNWSWEGDFSSGRQVGSKVNRLKFSDKDENGEGYFGAISKSDLEEVILSEGSDEYSERDGFLFGTTVSTAFEPSDSQKDIEIGREVVSKSPVDVRSRKRQRCLYLLLLLLLLAVAILGILLGTKREDGAVGAELTVTVLVVPNATNSSQPSTAPSFVSVESLEIPSADVSDAPSYSPEEMPSGSPSLAPSRECPLGMKAVTIDYVELYNPPSSATDFANQQYTLSVKNACYGNVVARCLPCPMKGVASPAWSLNKNVRTRRVDETVFENNDYASTTICIPDMQEYHLEVAPIPSYSDISPCCGLTSNLAPRVTYDGVIVAEGERDAYFGDKEGGCQSQLPSAAPTERPSASPSGYLSSPPSSTPTSSAPTKSPLAFAGPCLEEFVLLSYYSVGTRISRGGFIYECMRVSCGSYGHDPGSSTSNLWRQSWTIVGTCTGTFKPTIDPSRSPTDDPTRMPTSNPTRLPTPRPITPSPTPGRPAGNPTPRPTPECTTERDLPFNMCLAFDMSGSVCNDGTSSDCDQCATDTFLFEFLGLASS